jgi:hypothetical protein
MRSILIRLTCAAIIFLCGGCYVEIVERPPVLYRGIYERPYSGYYRNAIVTPIAHGFDPCPQYIGRGSWIFRNPNDGMLYSIR